MAVADKVTEPPHVNNAVEGVITGLVAVPLEINLISSMYKSLAPDLRNLILKFEVAGMDPVAYLKYHGVDVPVPVGSAL